MYKYTYPTKQGLNLKKKTVLIRIERQVLKFHSKWQASGKRFRPSAVEFQCLVIITTQNDLLKLLTGFRNVVHFSYRHTGKRPWTVLRNARTTIFTRVICQVSSLIMQIKTDLVWERPKYIILGAASRQILNLGMHILVSISVTTNNSGKNCVVFLTLNFFPPFKPIKFIYKLVIFYVQKFQRT